MYIFRVRVTQRLAYKHERAMGRRLCPQPSLWITVVKGPKKSFAAKRTSHKAVRKAKGNDERSRVTAGNHAGQREETGWEAIGGNWRQREATEASSCAQRLRKKLVRLRGPQL